MRLRFIDLVKARWINGTEYRRNLAKYLKSKDVGIITIDGKPKMVAIPYGTMIKILEKSEAKS